MNAVRPITEADLQQCVIDYAHLTGWWVAHFRPAQTSGRWSAPVSADGAGFPDLVMARRGEVVIAELKSEKGRISDAQQAWLTALSSPDVANRWLRVFVWRPADWFEGRIERALR
jgi:hypothetical protein